MTAFQRMARLVLALLIAQSSGSLVYAEYETQITTPSAPFYTYPATTFGCGGWVDWTWPFDDTVYYVLVEIWDWDGHFNTHWANCTVGYSSTTWTVQISTQGLHGKIIMPGQPLTNEAWIRVRAHDQYSQLIGEVGSEAMIVGHISI